MSNIPNRFCKPGQRPSESPEPCVPEAVTVDFQENAADIVNVNGEEVLPAEPIDGDALDMDA
ncbi:MAG: hypothetical protein LIP28_00030 [Deltaproteobacteria bacterium]|nr:hypothetical protein [Deltaproteobacteria bacterium]